MKLRSLLAAVVVLLVLGGVLYWSEHRKPATSSSASSETPTILKVDPATVTALTVKRRGEPPVTLDKSSGQWQITGPTPAAADGEAVSGMFSDLSPLTAQRVVDEKARDLATFGLNDPTIELDITTKGNKTSRLLVGDSTPTGDAVYVAY